MNSTFKPWSLPVAELKSFPPGANSPAQAAFVRQESQAAYQNRLAKLGGRRVNIARLIGRAGTRTRRRRGGANQIPIYTPPVPYDEPSTGSQTIAAINKNITSTLVQNQANSVYDKQASLKGGKKRSRKSRRKSRKSRRKSRK